MRCVLSAHVLRSFWDIASAPNIKVFNVGTSDGSIILTKEGVSNAVLTSISLMTLAVSFSRALSSGTQTQPPCIKVVNISVIDASKVYDANWSILDVDCKWIAGPCTSAALTNAPWDTKIPLGLPVVPLVKMTYAILLAETGDKDSTRLEALRTLGKSSTMSLTPSDLQASWYLAEQRRYSASTSETILCSRALGDSPSIDT